MGAPAEVIAVRLPNWLGDSVMALPALAAIRAARSAARIELIGRWAPLLAGQGVADAAVSYPRGFAERRRFARALASDPPDWALLLPNSMESALAARWWGARARVGFDADGRRPFLTHPLPRPAPPRHQVEEYGLLAGALGAAVASDAVPAWRATPALALEREVDELLVAEGLDQGARAVGLHLGAAFGPSKLWPTRSFGLLAKRLRESGRVPLLLGSSADQPAADAVAEAAGAPPLGSLVGRDRPALLPHLLRRLSALVSGDTGVAHLAAAAGVPTVTLFGPTDARLTAPRGARARAIIGQAPCAPCFLSTCPIDHVCLESVAVDRVWGQVDEVVPR